MDLTHENVARLAEITREHEPVTTEDGFIDCSCGWESNHPRVWSSVQRKNQADSEHPDPIDAEGKADPEHIGNPEPQQAHLAALQMEYLASTQPYV